MLFGSIFGFPLSLRMVEEMLAARGICVTYETVRQWGKKFGKAFSDRIRQRAPAHGDKWHMDEVVVSAEQTSCFNPDWNVKHQEVFIVCPFWHLSSRSGRVDGPMDDWVSPLIGVNGILRKPPFVEKGECSAAATLDNRPPLTSPNWSLFFGPLV